MHVAPTVESSVPVTPVVIPPMEPSHSSRVDARAERFAFPEVSAADDAPLRPTPYAIWPKCDCTETKAACVALAEKIQLLVPKDKPCVLGITSPGDCDGKTRFVTAIAPELAKRFGRVLAVDADLDREGLTSQIVCISGEEFDEAVSIYPTDCNGLNVAPMRRQDRELAWFDAAGFEELRKNWPFAILDMASLQHSATAGMLRHCDAACLIVRIGHTPRHAAAKSVEIIETSGTRFLGCVAIGDADFMD